VDLRELCDDVSGSLRVAAQPSCAHLSVEGAAHAVGDRARLRQVVFNLVKNAAESAGPKGHVNVAVRLSGDVAEVAVSDDGPGLDPQARARVFEPFFTTKPDGTGLGLAVSRAIARAHRGDIEIRSEANAGAVFTLTLPRSPEARS
jgi:signal transduction histidine kinase